MAKSMRQVAGFSGIASHQTETGLVRRENPQQEFHPNGLVALMTGQLGTGEKVTTQTSPYEPA